MSNWAVRTVTSGVQRSVALSSRQSYSIRATASLANPSPKIGRSQSASSALQYRVVSIVCAGPLRSTETFSVTHGSLMREIRRWRCDDGYDQCKAQRKAAAGLAVVLL